MSAARPSPLRPPVVSDRDRAWALALMPPWCRLGSGDAGPPPEIVDDGAWLDQPGKAKPRDERPDWTLLVDEQIEAFERFYANDRKTPGDWSRLWRNGWWPKVDARKRFPRSAPKEKHPFFRKGSPEFARALGVATEEEKRMWRRFGVAQFKPDDPRLPAVQQGGTQR